MEIAAYRNEYKRQIIDLILSIQNSEAKIGLSIDEQPDLLDIPLYYEKNGGAFWTAVENGEVIGTIAVMNYQNKNAVLKKFFVRADHRKKGVGYALYKTALEYLTRNGYMYVMLDTPSVAKASHVFYERAGFKKIGKDEMPFRYEYPDRNSFLYLLKIEREQVCPLV